MGCAPSRPATSIHVKQKCEPEKEMPDDDWRIPESSWMNDTLSKEILEIPDYEDGDLDKSSDSFLQVTYIHTKNYDKRLFVTNPLFTLTRVSPNIFECISILSVYNLNIWASN